MVDDGDIIRAGVLWDNVRTGQIANVFTLRVGTGGGSEPDDDVRDALAEYFVTLYEESGLINAMANDNIHNMVTVYNITQSTPLVPLPRNSALDGSEIADRLPSGVAMLIIGRTNISHKVAKKYLPPFTKAAWNDTGWVSAANTYGLAFANSWASEVGITGTTFTFRGVAGSGAASNFSDIVQAQVQPDEAYQRRRKRGRGA